MPSWQVTYRVAVVLGFCFPLFLLLVLLITVKSLFWFLCRLISSVLYQIHVEVLLKPIVVNKTETVSGYYIWKSVQLRSYMIGTQSVFLLVIL